MDNFRYLRSFSSLAPSRQSDMTEKLLTGTLNLNTINEHERINCQVHVIEPRHEKTGILPMRKQ